MVPFRPITRIQEMLDSIGLSITYAYDDLVFIEHNAFLLLFEKEHKHISLYLNVQSEKAEREGIINKLQTAASERDLIITSKGFFEMEQLENSKIAIRFC